MFLVGIMSHNRNFWDVNFGVAYIEPHTCRNAITLGPMAQYLERPRIRAKELKSLFRVGILLLGGRDQETGFY